MADFHRSLTFSVHYKDSQFLIMRDNRDLCQTSCRMRNNFFNLYLAWKRIPFFFFCTSFNFQALFHWRLSSNDSDHDNLSLESVTIFKAYLYPLSHLSLSITQLSDLISKCLCYRWRHWGSETLHSYESGRARSWTQASNLNPGFFLGGGERSQNKTKNWVAKKSVDCGSFTWGWEISNKEAIFHVDSKCEFSGVFFLFVQELCCFKRPFLLIQNEKIPSDSHAISRAFRYWFPLFSALPFFIGLHTGSWQKGKLEFLNWPLK